MLFFLTGDVQIGKTRWLQRLVDDVAAAGVPVAGVLAPGDWVPAAGSWADGNGFEKRGIDNVLLPSGERLPFARRRDLAQLEGSFDAASQSARAQLAWEIDDAAIARVNEHFRQLVEGTCGDGAERGEVRASGSSEATDACVRELSGAGLASAASGLLIVDELGRLELQRGEGLTEAVALLRQGPTSAFPHALAVVREELVDEAERQLGGAWPDRCRIAPDEAGRAAVLEAVGA
ncbi:hypothetical protein PZH32_01935 [Adlercreutzia equolifaciens]|uniref:hypothetical protein n=1 Tax=Adlercreutzia equolifaciens TaxID=446660 RepID=UPI0023B10BB1|nr:hypothetical protein [Adlercreutzia equolifaciens]MDE8701717.1 hypothetical protein [Adlercreutzia equolifaciens]